MFPFSFGVRSPVNSNTFAIIHEPEYQALSTITSHVTYRVFIELKRKCWRRPDFLNAQELQLAHISPRAYSGALRQLQLAGLIKQSGTRTIKTRKLRLWTTTVPIASVESTAATIASVAGNCGNHCLPLSSKSKRRVRKEEVRQEEKNKNPLTPYDPEEPVEDFFADTVPTPTQIRTSPTRPSESDTGITLATTEPPITLATEGTQPTTHLASVDSLEPQGASIDPTPMHPSVTVIVTSDRTNSNPIAPSGSGVSGAVITPNFGSGGGSGCLSVPSGSGAATDALTIQLVAGVPHGVRQCDADTNCLCRRLRPDFSFSPTDPPLPEAYVATLPPCLQDAYRKSRPPARMHMPSDAVDFSSPTATVADADDDHMKFFR
jgi:hypothetical protein